MMLEDILYELREVEAGHRLLHRPLAKQAADALELMVDRVRYLEETLKKTRQELAYADANIRILQDEFGL